MSLIKNLILIFFTAIICYSFMLVSDWLLLRISNNNIATNIEYTEAKKIENERSITEDIPERKKAISEGFSPIVYPSLMDTLNIKYPLVAGIPVTDTYYCNEGYGLIKYHSDRFGFRNEDSIWDETSLNIMIGDSYVHGACVEDKSTLPYQLSEMIEESVINMGMSGNSPSHYLTYATLFIPKLEPRFVYLVFYANDNGLMNKSAIERKYILEREQLFSNSELELFDVDTFKKEGKNVVSIISANDSNTKSDTQKSLLDRGLGAFFRHAMLPNIIGMLFQKPSSFNITEQTVRTTNDLCDLYGCKVVVSYIPNSEFYRPDARADDYGDRLAKLSKKVGLKFIDGRLLLDRTKGSLDFAIKGPHLSPYGYRKMAIALAAE